MKSIPARGIDTGPNAPRTTETPEWRRLFESAIRFAVSALDARGSADHAVLLLHAGTSLEHLTKSKLSSVHPALVRESRREKLEFDLLLHACGQGKSAEPLEAMRTVSLTGALERCERFVPGLKALRSDLQPLVEVPKMAWPIWRLFTQSMWRALRRPS